MVWSSTESVDNSNLQTTLLISPTFNSFGETVRYETVTLPLVMAATRKVLPRSGKLPSTLWALLWKSEGSSTAKLCSAETVAVELKSATTSTVLVPQAGTTRGLVKRR